MGRGKYGFLGCFACDFTWFAYVFEDSDDVDGCVFFDFVEFAEFDKVEAGLR